MHSGELLLLYTFNKDDYRFQQGDLLSAFNGMRLGKIPTGNSMLIWAEVGSETAAIGSSTKIPGSIAT